MVQKRLSSQGAPSFFGCCTQPICGSHTPSEQIPLRNEQSIGKPLAQLPPEQLPQPVQGSLSSHWAPSLPGMLPQLFVTGSHTPTWQVSGGGQNLVRPPVHRPSTQVSASVHQSLSSQG